MREPALPPDEAARLAVLRSLHILDTPAEERFDRITRLAQRVFSVPIALVSLVDANRQWFKSCQGLDATETPRGISFCGHAILQNVPLIVEDALHDLSNAHKYTPANGTIRIEGARQDDFVRLTVTDNGIGIFAGDQAKLFTKFYRADNSMTRKIGGMGLGLSIVKSVVEMMARVCRTQPKHAGTPRR